MHGTGAPLGRYSEEVPQDAKDSAARAAERLESAKRVLILGHAGADGDVAGSSLALAGALRERGVDVTVYNQEPLSEIFAFLPGADTVVDAIAPDAHFDVTVVVDTADPARCGRDFPPAERRGTYVWVDHHRLDNPPGDLNYIDLTAAAVGEQIAEILDALGHPLSKPVAECLYASLMTDTGAFRYGNTSTRAFRLAGRLVAAGVEPWEMTQRLYESQDPARVRLLGSALSSLEMSASGRWGMLVVTDADVAAAGADEAHVHGIVNHVRGIRGVEVAVLIRMFEKHSRVIFRSRGRVAIAPIAKTLGGKGTKNAAKVDIDAIGDAARDRVRQALEAHVETARLRA